MDLVGTTAAGMLGLTSKAFIKGERSVKENLDCVDGAPIGSKRRRQDFREGCLWRPPSIKWPAAQFYCGCAVPHLSKTRVGKREIS